MCESSNQISGTNNDNSSGTIPIPDTFDLDRKVDEVKRKKSELFSDYQHLVDLNCFRLKLQVIMYDLARGKLENYITEPVYTTKIENNLNGGGIHSVSNGSESSVNSIEFNLR